jgi:predicted RNA-binding protein YlxR (DUF448 family)
VLDGMRRASRDSAACRRCIYCREEKPIRDFNREHVLNDSFGRFQNNLVLRGCVCTECNTVFGKSIDRKLARDSMESVAHVKDPLLASPDGRGVGVDTTTSDASASGFRAVLEAIPRWGGERVGVVGRRSVHESRYRPAKTAARPSTDASFRSRQMMTATCARRSAVCMSTLMVDVRARFG